MTRQVLSALLAGAALVPAAPAQTLDEVIAKSFEARGGLDKLKAVQSLRMSGRMTMGTEAAIPMTIEIKRPASFRADFGFPGSPVIQACDGKTAWGIPPAGGPPQRLPAEAAREMAGQADLEGPLADYQAKGLEVELLGRETVDGKEAFKIQVTRKDGNVEHYYLDARSYLPVKVEVKRAAGGGEVEGETRIGGYRPAGGILWPHVIENGARGRPEKQKITVEAIEVNPVIDDARFRMPGAAGPPRRD